jgi:uncharacterized membrane protein
MIPKINEVRKRMRRSNELDATEDETIPILSEEEQEKLINEVKDEANQQSDLFRNIFAGLFIVIGIIFIICGLITFNEPYKLEHQKHFRSLVPVEFFLIYYVGSAFCFGVAAAVARVRLPVFFSFLLFMLPLCLSCLLLSFNLVSFR